MEIPTANEQQPQSVMETRQSTQPDKERVEDDKLTASALPIVRTSTPRLSSPGLAADFPSQAPAAPPLPEVPEMGQDTANVTGADTLLATAQAQQDEAPEFAWLFEYGLEMEPAYLNSPERLNGLAYRYGPARAQGYELHSVELANGRIAPTLVKCDDQDKQVWGILYRVPRRLLAHQGSAPATLDTVHHMPAFVPVQVRVQELYRDRAIDCITYMTSQPSTALPADQSRLDGILARQLLRIGKQQELPATYLAELAAFLVPLSKNDISQVQHPQVALIAHKQQVEQDTEPLPALANERASSTIANDSQQGLPVLRPPQKVQPGGWLYALSFYLVLLLLAALALAVIQALGFGGTVFTASFTPLGAPWYVPLYGLLGGCISTMLTLGKLSGYSSRPKRALPGFVVVTWFARPFAGAILAALAYFLLNSGLFLLSLVPSQRYAAYAVVAAVAGLCEGRLLFRQR